MLSEVPSDIKVGRILRALEGPLSVTDEDDEEVSENESSIRKCIRINVWEKMNKSLNELVDSITWRILLKITENEMVLTVQCITYNFMSITTSQ